MTPVDSYGTAPPPVPFVLSVGVTGHRQDALPADELPRLPARIKDALQLLTRSAAKVHSEAADCFAPGDPRLLFVSPLAHGADQMAAEVARARSSEPSPS